MSRRLAAYCAGIRPEVPASQPITISISCPQCGQDYQLTDAAAGKRFRCRGCETIICVPQSGDREHDRRGTDFDWDEPRPVNRRPDRKQASQNSLSVDTLLPAICMYFSAGLYIPIVIIALINGLLQPIDPAGLPPPGPQRDGHIAGYRVGQITASLFFVACSSLELMGAFHLHTHRSRKLVLTGAILCCIPCLSPCLILGIPIGIWSLVVLNLDTVKSRFS